MSMAVNYKETIIKQLENLSPELIQEVIDFAEFLKIKRMKTGGMDPNSLILQQESLGRIWDSKTEDIYEL